MTAEPRLYEALAATMAASIAAGTLGPGDKLPSVRQLVASRGVSPATVFEAYALLEARGLIRSKPRSGYYVARPARVVAAAPERVSSPDDAPQAVRMADQVFAMLQAAASRDIVPLGSAFPTPLLYPLKRIGRALAATASQLDPWTTVETLTPGSLDLRRQIALRYLLDGAQVSTDELIVTNGAMEALNLSLAAVCRPGDAVVVESPCFYACLQALERLGLRAVEVATDPRTGLDLDAFEAAIVKHRPAAAWVMTNFQNPLGSSMPEAKKRALVELVHRHRVPLIEDDVYHELYFGDARPVSTKVFDREGWVLHCSSFSKSLAPGYRIGWVSAGRFTREVAQQKLAASLGTAAPTQLALAHYLARGSHERDLRALRGKLRTKIDRHREAIAKAFPPGTRISDPSGGYFLWVELPNGCDAMAIAKHAMAEGISVAPGPMFSPSGGFANCLRINCGHTWTPRVAAAIDRLGQLAATRYQTRSSGT